MMTHAVCTVLAALALARLDAYEGPSFTVTAWRGETAYAVIPDNLALEVARSCSGTDAARGPAAAAIADIRLYSVEPTPYTEKPFGEQLSARLDRLADFPGSGRPAARAPAVCRVAVKADARPAVYDLGPLQVRVIDRVLPPPAEWKYYLDLWQHPWAAAREAGAEPFSDAHYRALEPVMKTLAECGQKVLTTTLVDLPWNHQCYDAYHSMVGRVKKADGTWSFDYAVFDEYVEFGRKCGIGPDIACYTMCPWGYVVRWQDATGAVQRVRAQPGTPAFEEYWGDFLVDFARHLKEKGWFENTYVAMDERAPDDVRNIVALIQKKAPGLKVSMAGNRKASDFKGIVIDNYCQGLDHLSDDCFAELPARRAQGFVTTYYVCCSPQRPNTFMTSSNDEAFWNGVFPAMAGLDGFLRWAANSWPADPCANAAFAPWAPGDTFLVYPGGFYSTRLVNLRDGIVAAEKLRILEERGLFPEEIRKVRGECDFRAAMAGRSDLASFRRHVEALVNRP